MRRLTPSSTLFPYTTLFRSTGIGQLFGGHRERCRPGQRRERGRWRRLHRRRLHRRWLHRGPLLLRQFLAHQPVGLEVEDPNADHDSGTALVDDAHVREPPVVARPVDDPAPRRRDFGDLLAGARSWPWLPSWRDAGIPKTALAGIRQVTGRHLEDDDGDRRRLLLGRTLLRRRFTPRLRWGPDDDGTAGDEGQERQEGRFHDA